MHKLAFLMMRATYIAGTTYRVPGAFFYNTYITNTCGYPYVVFNLLRSVRRSVGGAAPVHPCKHECTGAAAQRPLVSALALLNAVGTIHGHS